MYNYTLLQNPILKTRSARKSSRNHTLGPRNFLGSGFCDSKLKIEDI